MLTYAEPDSQLTGADSRSSPSFGTSPYGPGACSFLPPNSVPISSLTRNHGYNNLNLSPAEQLLHHHLLSGFGKFGAVVNRAEAQVLRLAILYALLDRANVIESIHLHAALAVWDYCEASARFIFGNHESNPYSRRIKAAVEAGPKSLTDLHSLFSRMISKTDLDEAVQELIAQGAVELEKIKTNGRPKTMIKIAEQSQQSTEIPEKSLLNTNY